MRIVHLVSSHRWTGAAEPSFGLAQEQLRLGHDVHFACARGAQFERVVRESELTWVPGLDLRPTAPPHTVCCDVHRLRRLVNDGAYDVIHCHLAHAHWIAALALAARSRKRPDTRPLLVRTFHRDVAPRTDPLHRWLYATATPLVITVSRHAQMRDMNALRLGPDRVAWIPGAVDADRFHPDVDPDINRALWSIPHDATVAGMPAEMQPHRGHLEFVNTLSEVQQRVGNIRYVLMGAGEWKPRIDARVVAHPLKALVVDAGYRADDLPETYAAMNVAVILAPGSDGACRAMLEAMASGRPVIGANVGAIADTIEPGKTGWLVDPGKPQDLIDALVDALGNPARTAAMGREARTRVEEKFTQRMRADAVIAAYGVHTRAEK